MVAKHAALASGHFVMSSMTLIRHGQASFFSDDYDQLSPTGHEQSRLLGRFWGVHGYRFTHVFAGPRVRQTQTASLIGDCFREAGGDWPEPVVLAELDEYDLTGLMTRLAPALGKQDSHFAGLIEANRQAAETRDRLRTFQTMFEQLLVHWQSESLSIEGLESWAHFRKRVAYAIEHIQTNVPQGSRIAVVTSGGFIGTVAQSVLAAPERSALELNWRVRNSSLTELVFTRERLSLDSFNAVPHLPDPKHWTYR
jgi:broad specificity phosphatase PhoE